MDEVWPQEEARSDFEPDPDLLPPFLGGGGWTPVDPNVAIEQPVLANAIEPDEFPVESADDITGLLTLGYLKASFSLFGHDFLIRTLKRGERMDALLLSKEYEGTLGQADAVQTALLAASIELVDGHPLTSALSPNEQPIIRIKRNFEKLSEWYEPVLDGIYSEYSSLVQRQAVAFDVLQGKSRAIRPSH